MSNWNFDSLSSYLLYCNTYITAERHKLRRIENEEIVVVFEGKKIKKNMESSLLRSSETVVSALPESVCGGGVPGVTRVLAALLPRREREHVLQRPQLLHLGCVGEPAQVRL